MPRNNPEEANQKGVTSHEDLVVFEHRSAHFPKLEPVKIQSRGWILGSFHGYHPKLPYTRCKVQSCRPHGSSRSESEFHAPGSACGGNAEAGNSDDPACNKTLKLAGLSEDFTCFHHMKGKDPLHHCRKIISCPSIYPSSLQPFWNARKVSEYVRMYQVVTLLLVKQETNWEPAQQHGPHSCRISNGFEVQGFDKLILLPAM